jgi:hypothetical protein
MVKVLVSPADELMRQLIALKAFGLSEIDAVRYYTALEMAKRGVVSAPNMAVGVGFNIGSTLSSIPVPLYGSTDAAVRPPIGGEGDK